MIEKNFTTSLAIVSADVFVMGTAKRYFEKPVDSS